MNDEATAYYTDTIDQLTLGLRFIQNEFGNCSRPRIGWQVDPFGHTREQGSIFAQFGFDGLFIGRDDILDELERAYTKTREMLWKASPNLGESADIFTGLLPIGYATYPYMCFDSSCSDDPIIDNPDSDEYNLEVKLAEFLVYTEFEAAQFKTSNLVMTFGGDFQFTNAKQNFKNLDKLIYHVNQRRNETKVNAFYSTPSCYLYSLYKANKTWPLMTEDFVPYASRSHTYWTGFYTSRAALKRYVRTTSNLLQGVRQLVSYSTLKDNTTISRINALERALGVVQHHDAVSGTENQHVANDYSKRMASAIIGLVDSLPDVLSSILGAKPASTVPVFYCPLLNISECLPIENSNNIKAIIYNPLAVKTSSWIRIPLATSDYSVVEVNSGQELMYDVVPVDPQTKLIPERQSKANYEIVFNAENLPPLGFKVYIIKKLSKLAKIKENRVGKKTQKHTKAGEIALENEFLKLSFDANGNLKSLYNLETYIQSELSQDYCYYKSKEGDNKKGDTQSSGAYIFRPQEDTPVCYNVRNFTVYHGTLYDEIQQNFTDWLSQTIRLYKNATNAEFNWQVGPIYADDQVGKEIIFKMSTDIKSDGLFSTDSNGREMLERKRSFRHGIPDFPLSERVAGNYYPINSRIFVKDAKKTTRQITLITDRSQGASSLQDGSIEIMLHRRILHDDGFGVHENLDELGIDQKGLIVKGKLNLLFNNSEASAKLHRQLAHEVSMQPLVLFDTSDDSAIPYENLNGWSATTEGLLPKNVHLLTLMKDFAVTDQQDYMLVRLEHFYEHNEDPVYSEPVQVDLQALFNKTFTITSIEELSLGANMGVDELNNRLKWNGEKDVNAPKIVRKPLVEKTFSPYVFNLNPMQIRTFRIKYSR